MPRPFIALPDVHLLINKTGLDSFPSGHATFFAALAISIYFYHTKGPEQLVPSGVEGSRGKKLGLILGFFALLIGLARIIGGAHFPVDIFGGYLLGIGISVLTYKLFGYRNKKP
jgi:undecaprenyl-diphosphatase